jgi:hypothetical protein
MLKFITSFLNLCQQLYNSKRCLGLISILFMPLLVAGCNSLGRETPPKMPDTHISMLSSKINQQTYQVGERFQIGDLSYKINGVRTTDGANNRISSRKGNTFLLIDLTIENRGTTDAEVRSLVGFELKDNYGRKQAFSMGAVLAVEHEMDGTISAGSKMNGELGYEVQKVPQMFELIITPNPLKVDSAVVQVPLEII